MIRSIIKIDEDKCDGCGVCIPTCKEGALQIIDGKCRLISDLFCDGLGACIGECPEGAIIIEEREAEPYNERKVIEYLIDKPINVMIAHLKHLKEHGATEFFNEALEILKEKGIENPVKEEEKTNGTAKACGCSGSMMVDLTSIKKKDEPQHDLHFEQKSELTQWPIQLHLVNPAAPYFKNSELVIMSTCGPLASGSVHQKYLKGRSVVVACPKLDYTEPYTEKLAAIYAESNTRKVIVVRIEVPCCGGLSMMALNAVKKSGRNDIFLEEHTLSISGELLSVKTLAGKREKVLA